MAGPTDWSQLLHPDFESIEDMLIQWYCKDKLSLSQVGDRLGIDRSPVRKMLLKLHLPLHAKGKPGPNNHRHERKQKPNKPKDSFAESALRQEGVRLGMSPEDYIPVETRKSEKRDCGQYKNCSRYTAILYGLIVPCHKCDGQPEFFENMNRTIPAFEEILNGSDKKSNIRYYESRIPTSRTDASVMRIWLDSEQIDTSKLFINKRFEIYYVP